MLTNIVPEGVNSSIAVESNVVSATPKVTGSSKTPKGKKTGELTAIAKKWQTVLCYIVVCELFESGQCLTAEKQQTECMKLYQAILPDFVNKRKMWASVSEYNVRDFSQEQLMLSSGTKTMNGKIVLDKGKAARKDVVNWLATMNDSTNADVKRAFSFERLKMGTTDDEESSGKIAGACDVSWRILSGTNAECAANTLLVAIYNLQQGNIIAIDGDATAAAIVTFEDVPRKYVPPFEFILLKYFVILADSLGIEKNNFLCLSLSKCSAGASNSVSMNGAITGSETKKSRKQLTQERNQKNENRRVRNAQLRGEDLDSIKVLAQANAQFHLQTANLGQDIQLLTLMKPIYESNGDLQTWNSKLLDLSAQNAKNKEQYDSIVANEEKKKADREKRMQASETAYSKKVKTEGNDMVTPKRLRTAKPTTAAFASGALPPVPIDNIKNSADDEGDSNSSSSDDDADDENA